MIKVEKPNQAAEQSRCALTVWLMRLSKAIFPVRFHILTVPSTEQVSISFRFVGCQSPPVTRVTWPFVLAMFWFKDRTRITADNGFKTASQVVYVVGTQLCMLVNHVVMAQTTRHGNTVVKYMQWGQTPGYASSGGGYTYTSTA